MSCLNIYTADIRSYFTDCPSTAKGRLSSKHLGDDMFTIVCQICIRSILETADSFSLHFEEGAKNKNEDRGLTLKSTSALVKKLT